MTTNEDTDYTFAAANFNFTDTDSGAALSSVKIVTLPAPGKGTLKLDGSAIAAANLPKTVSKADIDAGKLIYTPPANANGSGYASFTFKVNDGTDDSASAYTLTLDVTALNDPATGTPTITGTARVGQTLTAATSAIMDADGLTGPHLRLPVDPGGHRQHRDGHFRGDVERLHPGRRRPPQDHQGQGELQRRRRQPRDAHQHGDGGGQHPPLAASDHCNLRDGDHARM